MPVKEQRQQQLLVLLLKLIIITLNADKRSIKFNIMYRHEKGNN
jgi:hypothetical protein